MGEQQKNRGLVAREGSVTRKGREGPAARAAKTHRRRRGEASKRLLEKLITPPRVRNSKVKVLEMR